jgi:hypothetical protein
MTIQELNKKYINGELSNYPGDNSFRYEVISPLFNNLFENKVVYHERFTCIVILENLIIKPELFEATAKPYLQIEKGSRLDKTYPKNPWKFDSVWSNLRLIDNCINALYSGWNIWVDPDTVQMVEKFVLDK